jgi:hypothetical protein
MPFIFMQYPLGNTLRVIVCERPELQNNRWDIRQAQPKVSILHPFCSAVSSGNRNEEPHREDPGLAKTTITHVESEHL